jgi:hypothetical protein
MQHKVGRAIEDDNGKRFTHENPRPIQDILRITLLHKNDTPFQYGPCVGDRNAIHFFDEDFHGFSNQLPQRFKL